MARKWYTICSDKSSVPITLTDMKKKKKQSKDGGFD